MRLRYPRAWEVPALVNSCNNLCSPFRCSEDAVLPCTISCAQNAFQGPSDHWMGPLLQHFHPTGELEKVSPWMGKRTSPPTAEDTTLPLKMCSNKTLPQTQAGAELSWHVHRKVNGRSLVFAREAQENKLENRGQDKPRADKKFWNSSLWRARSVSVPGAMVGSYGSVSSLIAVILQIPAKPCPGEGLLQGKGGEGTTGAHRPPPRTRPVHEP